MSTFISEKDEKRCQSVEEEFSQRIAGEHTGETTSSDCVRGLVSQFRYIVSSSPLSFFHPNTFGRESCRKYIIMANKKCEVCKKTVYAMERIRMGDGDWHKWCFKCSECSLKLDLRSVKVCRSLLCTLDTILFHFITFNN